MLRKPDTWFYPYEFMMPELGDLFVGYKAPTRIAEMHKAYPKMFNTRTVDKYVQRKINREEGYLWVDQLPDSLNKIVDSEYSPGAEMLTAIENYKCEFENNYNNVKAISWLKDEE